jgi:hypothetical protein
MENQTKNALMVEYAALATLNEKTNQDTIRMEQIQTELQMTPEAILREATKIAIATFR